MNKLLFVGECMLELRRDENGQVHTSYAGDTYNSAVYAKRTCPESEVAYLSAVGDDVFSQQLLSNMATEGIDSHLVGCNHERNLGIYSITTDNSGERSFAYWRENSAAKNMLKQCKESLIDDENFALIFFSGITLAILDQQDRQKLLSILHRAKSRGVTIAFDPNYRARLWADKTEAKYWLEQAYALADIALPGLEDHDALFQHTDAQQVHDFLNQFGVQEQVIKCGVQGTYVYDLTGIQYHQPFKPAAIQRDTTGAGDSFAGAYLVTRCDGLNIEQATMRASELARTVVQFSGAIVASELTTNSLFSALSNEVNS
ncbi:2-keto-3-deoxygluconate kinase [Paraglaciecola sp. T6c]|uniref:sugar kinase n=1 Tax=Pseudoalteromonas atlantica (strain T6c / ATCC BAA-1087) TaxID=3042615 RepID=UPI00005C682F|nr:sugar kinase [Paraglaciecola sp. T6c]ABG39364.1 2-keto-3-deoxygluconate kinase [Paraglaciecola sp. T6c]